MITLELPKDPELLAAIGRISIRHGQLDHSLKLTIKSILGVSIPEAVDGTHRQGSSKLRNRINAMTKNKFGEGETLLRLEALLNRASMATEKRNRILHSLFAHELDGSPVIRNDDHSFGPTPNPKELNAIADELFTIIEELTTARLDGFLKEALSQ